MIDEKKTFRFVHYYERASAESFLTWSPEDDGTYSIIIVVAQPNENISRPAQVPNAAPGKRPPRRNNCNIITVQHIYNIIYASKYLFVHVIIYYYAPYMCAYIYVCFL